ncbi:MAG: PAS domain S-box protein [Planctomycetes bacterium]|nr:PAS domain S-box protein [Planctomycetota bacterium]
MPSVPAPAAPPPKSESALLRNAARALAPLLLALGWWQRDRAAVAVPALVAGGAAAATAVLAQRSRMGVAASVRRATVEAEQARERALDAASAHSARIQAIVDTATEGIVTIDSAGRIDTFNGAAERLFGYRAAEVLGRNVSVLMPPPHCDDHDGYLQRYLTTGVRHIIGIGREVAGRRKDGTTFPIELSVGEGWIGGQRFFTAVIRDVTERKEMQTKLGQAERLAAVGELAAGVAHEINNPINTIINCAQLIRDGDAPDDNCLVIQEEGARIAEIVKDLLQFARDDSDRPQPTSIFEVVQRTLRLVGENFKRHGVDLTVDVAEDLPYVKARPQQIQQVLLNLLINAKDALLQAGGDDRRVWMSARVDGYGVQLEVADNGPGIPGHLGLRIFEPFVTTKRARGGTGLGLSISKSIVEGYNGTLDVESEPGQGATFRVWLPLVERGD